MQIGPKFKICRRLGDRVFPKCQTTKFTTSAGGVGGAGRERAGGGGRPRRGASDYADQLLEKQRARYTYCLSETQFANYVKRARAMAGAPAANLYRLLESRLDNTIFRLGLATSRRQARQIVTHGHILVNGRRVNFPSFVVKLGDKITVRPQSRDRSLWRDLAERAKTFQSPEWLRGDLSSLEGQVAALPAVTEAEPGPNLSAIIEFYSRV